MSQERLKDFEPFWQEWYIEEKVETGNFSDIFKLKKEFEDGDVIYKAMRVIEIPRVQATASSGNLGERRQALHGYFGELVKVVEEEIQALHVLNGKPNILPYEAYEVLERQELVGYDILLLTPIHKSFISYISGRNLEDNSDIIQMAKDICRALEEIHKMDFLHKDLKLENIYMDDEGNYYLGEIGIENRISTFQTGSVKRGPYEYLAPEVYLNKEYSKKADIYSLGVILYILCNDGKIPKELQRRDRNGELPLPCKAKERLSEIIFKAMAYEMNERYDTAESMLEDLETLTEDDIAFPIIEEKIEEEIQEVDAYEEQESIEELSTENNQAITEFQNYDNISAEGINERNLEFEAIEEQVSESSTDVEFVEEITEEAGENGFNYGAMKETWNGSGYGAANEILSGNGLDITEQIIFGNHSFGVTEENILEEYTEKPLEDLEDVSLDASPGIEGDSLDTSFDIGIEEDANLETTFGAEESTSFSETDVSEDDVDFENRMTAADLQDSSFIQETSIDNEEGAETNVQHSDIENVPIIEEKTENNSSYGTMEPNEIMENVEQQYYDQFATKTIGSTINLAMQTAQAEREKEQEQRIQEMQNVQSEENSKQEYSEEEQPVVLKPAMPKSEEGEVILKPASSYYSQTSFTIPTDSKKETKEHTAVKKQGDFWKNTPAVGTYVDDMQEPVEIPIKAMPKKKKKTGVFLAILFVIILAAVVVKLLYDNGAITFKEKKTAVTVEKMYEAANENVSDEEL